MIIGDPDQVTVPSQESHTFIYTPAQGQLKASRNLRHKTPHHTHTHTDAHGRTRTHGSTHTYREHANYIFPFLSPANTPYSYMVCPVKWMH